VASTSLLPNGRALTRPLPPNWSIAMRARFRDVRSTLRVSLGSTVVSVFDGSHVWHRVALTRRGLVVDGHHSGAAPLQASSVTLRAVHGAVEILGLVISRGKG
jgi:hypothetical protein